MSVTVIATGFDSESRSFANQKTTRSTLHTETEDYTPPARITPPKKEEKNDFEDFHISSSGFSFDLEAPVEEEPKTQGNLFEQERVESSRKEESTPSRDRNQKALEDRIHKLKSSDYNYHNPDTLKKMEDMPAYMRKEVEVEEESRVESRQISRTSLEDVDDKHFRLNNNNSYLHDQVD